jgi:hypothetical protein
VGRSSVGGSVVEVDSGTVVVGFTVLATVVEYQIKGEWLERHATTRSSLASGWWPKLASDGFLSRATVHNYHPKRYDYRLYLCKWLFCTNIGIRAEGERQSYCAVANGFAPKSKVYMPDWSDRSGVQLGDQV